MTAATSTIDTEAAMASSVTPATSAGPPNPPSHSKSGSGPSDALAWVGAVIINVAFSGLVAWGAATQWILGCVLSAVYTGVLLGGARWWHGKQHREHTVLISLLFLLGVVGVGVTGSFVPINVWGSLCSDGPRDPSGGGRVFVTDVSLLPSDIAPWFQEHTEPYRVPPGGATFAYLGSGEGTATTLFVGSDGGDGSGNQGREPTTSLFTVSSLTIGPPADLHADLDPLSNAGLASNGVHACLQTRGGLELWPRDPDREYNPLCAIGCTDGEKFTAIAWRDDCYYQTYQFSAADDRLYLIGWVGGHAARSRIVASLDPSDMEDVMEYSSEALSVAGEGAPARERRESTEVEDVGGRACTEANQRAVSGGLLGLAFLPALVAAVALHRRRSVPSMSIGIYGAITGALLSIVALASPDGDAVYHAARWWLSLSSLAWLIGLVLAFLTGHTEASPLSWGLNFAGAAYFAGMLWLCQIFGSHYETWYMWVVLTLTCFAPVLLAGIVTGRLLLLVLGAVGIMIDIYRIAAVIGDAVDEGVRTPVTFVILAVSGLGLAVLGIFVNRRQDAMQAAVDKWTDSYLFRWKVSGAGSGAITGSAKGGGGSGLSSDPEGTN